jgi:DNA-binding transcriptional LysR family regulator
MLVPVHRQGGSADNMTVTLDQLKSFVAIAKHQSISKASVELHLTQPSVSKHLRNLEVQFNTKLYSRLGRGIELTDSGQLALKNAMTIVDEISKLQNLFTMPARRAERNILKVVSSHSPVFHLLPSLFALLRKKDPQVEIELTIRPPEQVERVILSSQAEIGTSTNPARSEELECELLRKQKLVWFVSRHHPLARKPRVTLAEILVTPLIIQDGRRGHGTTARLLKKLKGQGLEFNIKTRCEEPYAIKAAVRENLGIGIVFEDTVKAETASGEFKVLVGHGLRLEGMNFLIYPKGKPLSPTAEEFLRLARNVRQKNFPGGATFKDERIFAL